MSTTNRQYFVKQLRECPVVIAPIDLGILADDLNDLARDEFDADDPTNAAASENCETAWIEWLRRVGGFRNIASYAACLRAGQRQTTRTR